jgi:putative transposase
LRERFVYCVAIVDWYSRMVLAWRLSNTMDASFCIEALEEALLRYDTPEIFNSDQGAQFADGDFITALERSGTRISMESRRLTAMQ